MATLLIGELARRAHVNVETLRYYERRGLLRAPVRRASGYRQYGETDVARVQAIRRAQGFGFTLREILELLPHFETSRPRCASLKRHAARKIADLTRQIRQLEAARRALEELVESCAVECAMRGSRFVFSSPLA